MGANLLKGDRSRAQRVIQGYLTNNGTVEISGGSGFTVLRNGIGDITVTLSRPGRRFVSATCSVVEGTSLTGHFAKLLTVAPNAIRIATFVADGTDGALVDLNVSFFMTVSDVAI